jgi:regulator of extracellular matrix RemA (YlzA/DUF370 family)
MKAELLPIGSGGVIAVNRVLAIANPRSTPIKQVVRRAREEGLLIDLRYGRSSQAVVFFDSGHVALVALEPGDIVSRLKSQREGGGRSI